MQWQSCEKIRLSLEECDVEKDITTFIKNCGTGQEIPDPPKYIDFCREDAENELPTPYDDNYAVAQFNRTTNPAFRTASPQPPVIEPSQAQDSPMAQEPATTQPDYRPSTAMSNISRKAAPQNADYRAPSRAQQIHDMAQQDDLPRVPYNEYPAEGMTQYCRTGPPSDMSSAVSYNRPISRDESVYSTGASMTSPEPSVGSISPVKHFSEMSISSSNEHTIPKKKSSVFESRSPFARSRSRGPTSSPQKGLVNPSTGHRGEWSAPSSQQNGGSSPIRQAPSYSTSTSRFGGQPSPEPEPVDPRASFQLNVGKNVFDVASPDALNKQRKPVNDANEEVDPIAKALAELKGVTKQASVRQSADRYHGLATPAPGQQSPTRMGNNSFSSRSSRSEAPPSCDNTPVSRLGAPQPAFTSHDMQRTTQQYVNQAKDVFRSPSRQGSYDAQQQSPVRNTPSQVRPGQQSRPNSGYAPRSASPAPSQMRSTSPRPGMYDQRQQMPRATSPSPYHNGGDMRARSQSTGPVRNGSHQNGGYDQRMPRAVSPSPHHQGQFARSQGPPSQGQGQMVLSQGPPQGQYGSSQRGRPDGRYDQRQGPPGPDPRMRSKSAAGEGRVQYTKDGRPILHFCKSYLLVA